MPFVSEAVLNTNSVYVTIEANRGQKLAVWDYFMLDRFECSSISLDITLTQAASALATFFERIRTMPPQPAKVHPLQAYGEYTMSMLDPETITRLQDGSYELHGSALLFNPRVRYDSSRAFQRILNGSFKEIVD